MDFWEWLQRLRSGPSLRDSIQATLSRDADGISYRLSPEAEGGSYSTPMQLPGLTVEAKQQNQLPPEVRDLLLSGFVQDTLFPLVGGPPSEVTLRDRPSWPYTPNTLGAVEGPSDALKLVYYQQLFDPAARHSPLPLTVHESGHMFSARDIDPGIINEVKAKWTPEVASQWGDRGSNPEEMFAEAFSRALMFLRNSSEQMAGDPNPAWRLKELEDIRRSYSPPGTDLLVDYLLATPAYQAHPINSVRKR